MNEHSEHSIDNVESFINNLRPVVQEIMHLNGTAPVDETLFQKASQSVVDLGRLAIKRDSIQYLDAQHLACPDCGSIVASSFQMISMRQWSVRCSNYPTCKWWTHGWLHSQLEKLQTLRAITSAMISESQGYYEGAEVEILAGKYIEELRALTAGPAGADTLQALLTDMKSRTDNLHSRYRSLGALESIFTTLDVAVTEAFEFEKKALRDFKVFIDADVAAHVAGA